ncbi:MAG: serine--tRNA ligase [Candidatus Doudnabacteria bacterium RIFCSPHIGHO2_02_FULL_48_21]|uniref:Serine--tRNA ligase n=1 Tax=Candidatus Doudnabacteria bacterium RIFCSPLOWO2_02_FULL_48_13 TaxID=1817845 RepID=A0A1F5Q991_9BACT|nr:MAG: serine--tRNA ligase [Candidatus Doudnabacteria bacterium RIFCSPHIGHO2_01_48_18]OGE79581.1 MAG: serine--tRNA ligase [Candidatus Doudnabacteria bacterium RIFCSPHIGHO2_01_FULL_48_180]OGE91108.1 MAG: serine--tRNA ligase [Candidatus Doudnabacteria bacterium RIFCSPHIGHO2_12_FULL_47_25]OGE93798.1 MAG: serine--tRNA ligase [Candidatus Doudnabacteria bacterium RIFCSPHIGHO2_02_FULL_48_21]OGE97984.1 MAG: serine--tRNA ligase [Candidatus Doudnabacteria bacterium RIFCSPLOWO2_01_FULL_48_57]OGE98698.1 
MLDIKFIRENQKLIEKNNKDRGVKLDLGRLLELDEKRRAQIHEIDLKRAELKKSSKVKPVPDEIKKLKKLGETIKKTESELAKTETQFKELLQKVPNLTHADAPVGGENDFKILETAGRPPKFDFKAKDHEQLLTNLDLIDFERGAKVAESKFYFAKKDLVRLNQSLISYGIDVLSGHGYTLVETPDLAKNKILEGIGFNPRGPETQVYSVENTELSLIGTAEITMGGYHADEVLDLSRGAKRYAALSHCFRTEAGAYGKESKGLYRVHQFTKLEMFVYCKPEDSEDMHAELLSIEKEICDGLKIPYRVIDIASGDLGAPAYRKYDIEAWMVIKNDYGEITSTSNCTDYQARRLNIKYKNPDGSSEFVHTLNGTAIVTSRFPLAIVENHQQKDGSVRLPKILQKYMGKEEIR